VTGATTTNGLTNTGALTTTTLSATSDASVGGALAVTGNTTLGGTLAVTGLTATNGLANTGAFSTTTLSTTGDASIGGDLDMTNGQIRNLAAGTRAGDAINYGQLQNAIKKVAAGLASVSAMANIPNVTEGKTFAMGVGLGHHDGESAFAVGASYRVNKATVVRGSVAGGTTGKPTVGAGVSYSW